MADEVINKLGIRELLEKEKLSDDDIIIVEDTENTKRISFRDLRDSLIDDNELPSTHRIYSSQKVNNSIETIQSNLDRSFGEVEGKLDILNEKAATLEDVDKKIEDFSKQVPELTEMETIKKELDLKRSTLEPITCDDIETGEDAKKIQPKNLSYEVISMMVGTTPVTVPAVPKGGWVQEDIANGAIIADKLSKQYRFRGKYSEGNINSFVKDGLYLLSASIEGLPKYKDDEADQERLLEVYNFGDNQNIIQKVYYIEETDSASVRPVYTRKAVLSRLHITDFIAEYPVTDAYKLERKALDDNIFDYGVINSGSVYDLKNDGDYLVLKNVKNLPSDKYDYAVSVRKYNTRTEYVAKAVTSTVCEVYISNTYPLSSGQLVRTEWYQTNSVSKSRLDGQRLHLFGDGVCYGMGSTDIPTLSYPALLTSKYGITIQNHALGDATIGVYGDDYLEERSVIKQIQNTSFADNDLAIIFAGSNDYKSGIAKLGKDSDDVDTSFKGALNLCIKTILEKNSKVKLLIITPLFRARLDADNFRNSDETPINELLLSDYVTAMKEVSEYNHIPCLDLHSTSRINKYNFATYLSDRLYLNDYGHEVIADKIFSALDFYC